MELIGLWVLFGAIGLGIGQGKGRPVAGFLWGFICGPLGWLVMIVAPKGKT